MISVIIPAYNVEKYIMQCIESILNQTYKNIEIIIIDDGSTDGTKKVINEFLKNNEKIKFFEQSNKGVSEARNLGLAKASGEYVIFIDPDDFLEYDMLEKLIRKIKENDLDIVICGHTIYYDNNKKNIIKIYDIDENKVYSNDQCIDMMLKMNLKGYVWDKLFKRKELIKHGFVFESGRYIQDWAPVFKQIYYSKKIGFVNEPLYYYRQREGSTINKKKNKKIIYDFEYAVKEIESFLYNNIKKFNKESKEIFDIKVAYALRRYYYLYYYPLIGKEVYEKFKLESCYRKVYFTKRNIFNRNISFQLKIKLLLWDLKMMHLFK